MKRSIILICFILLFQTYGTVAYFENGLTKGNITTILNEYDMVIIAPNNFSNSIQNLINHKNSNNVETFLKTTEDIYNEYQGRDNQEQIKYFIKEALENHKIKHVFLIGDIDKVPVRKSWVRFSYGSNLMFENCITDLYYSDIYNSNGSFCSWDSNNNNKYGETIQDIDIYDQTFEYIDEIDLYPDVSIGRIPCSNINEVNIVIDKIINYETQIDDKEWFNRLILIGGDTLPYNYGWSYAGCEMYEGENITGYIGEKLDGFNSIKLWTSLNTFSFFHINNEINKGAGFISYSGHGSEKSFGTSLPNSSKFISYNALWINGLINQNKLPIMYLSACNTAKFNCKINEIHPNPLITYLYSLLAGVPHKPDNLYPCLAWQLVKREQGGAIATIGATHRALAGEAGDFINTGCDGLMVKFFLEYKPEISVGEMFLKAKQDYMKTVYPFINECINMEIFTLIGDPSLKVGGY